MMTPSEATKGRAGPAPPEDIDDRQLTGWKKDTLWGTQARVANSTNRHKVTAMSSPHNKACVSLNPQLAMDMATKASTYCSIHKN